MSFTAFALNHIEQSPFWCTTLLIVTACVKLSYAIILTTARRVG